MSENDLAALIAKRFIQRKDVKAIQVADGGYRPVREAWKMKDLRSHVEGTQTFGHYTCDKDGLTKVIVFDCDLDKVGTWVEVPSDEELATIESDADFTKSLVVHQSNPREDWLNRRHPGRAWYKYQMRTLVDAITAAVVNHLGLESVASYSGNKGAHVYAFFPEPVDIKVARKAALFCLEYAGKLISPNHTFEAVKGANFFKHMEEDSYYGVQNFTVEIYPKQESMEGKDLGNLVRLPLGVNQKNQKDPCFFIDQTQAQSVLAPHPNPAHLLATGKPFAKEGE